MKNLKRIVFGVAFAGVLGLLVLVFMSVGSVAVLLAESQGGAKVYGESKPHLSLVKLTGPIVDADEFLEVIETIKKNEASKGVLLRINSPGGAAAASQEIYKALLDLRKKKPVVVSLGNVAASGGYYIAIAGDKIFTNPATITGSIGVIAQFPNAEKLFEKVGVSLTVVKSGKFKDAGSLFRASTAEERAYLQGVINHTYEQFVRDISDSRELELKEVKVLADGRIFTGEQAVQYNLVDTLGGLLDAKAYLIQQSTLTGDPLFVEPKEGGDFLSKLTSQSHSEALLMQNLVKVFHSGIYFIWPGGVFEQMLQ